jgi:hypothetical protein
MTASVTVLDARSQSQATQSTSQHLPDVPHYSRDVATLLALLQSLPATVTPESGAQIIRATLDSMLESSMTSSEQSLSTASVLQQAQRIQADCLAVSRAYLDDIERCQERIRHLQALVAQCQAQATELADLIDVFLVPDSPELISA